MPYIQVRAYPKDKEIKKKVTERINQVFLEEWGCPPQAITISFEEVSPENWDEQVEEKIIKPNMEHVLLHNGEKKY